MLDTKIVNARVIDGGGRAAYSADVGILAGKIAAIGDLRETAAGERIDARGRALTPGFLDIHRHADLAILSPDFGDWELRQGLTTVVNGNCGLSAAPLAGEHREEVRRYLAPITGDAGERSFPTVGDYFRQCGALPLHAGELIGMGTLRANAAGFRPGPLTAAETAAMGVRGSRSSGVPSGRHSTERYRPSPSGDSKLRPMRPRPAVCRRAITAVPLGAPWAARLLHTVLVESTVS